MVRSRDSDGGTGLGWRGGTRTGGVGLALAGWDSHLGVGREEGGRWAAFDVRTG